MARELWDLALLEWFTGMLGLAQIPLKAEHKYREGLVVVEVALDEVFPGGVQGVEGGAGDDGKREEQDGGVR